MRGEAVLVAVAAIALSLSSVETLGTDSLVQELGSGDLGESMRPGGEQSIPMGDVTALTAKLEAQNRQLIAQNQALMSKTALAQAEQSTAGQKVSALQAPKKVVSPKELPREVQAGATVMSGYQKQIAELEGKLAAADSRATAAKMTEAKTRMDKENAEMDAAAAGKPVKYEYAKIPYFKGFAGSKEVKGLTQQGQCQNICNEQKLCKSFSWSQSMQLCFWSISAIDYDPHFVLGVRATQNLAGSPDAKFREFPGIKFINAQSKEKNGVSEADCQFTCESDLSCKSYSFKASNGFCAYGATGLSYDDEYTYFEKEAGQDKLDAMKKAQMEQEKAALQATLNADQSAEAAEQAKEKKENDQKDAEKAKWLAGNPSKQEQADIDAKVEEQNRASIAKMAAKGAEVAAEDKIKAEAQFQKDQQNAVASLAKTEADEKKVKAAYGAEKAKITPLAKKVADQEVVIAKLNAEIVMTNLDKKVKENGVALAQKALDDAQKANNNAAISAAEAAYKEAKSALTENENEAAKLQAALAESKGTLATDTETKSNAEEQLKEFAAQSKASEIAVKQRVKEEKTAIAKSKAALEADVETADRTKLISLKSQERVAKTARANGKVTLLIGGLKMQDIKTDDERTDLEQSMAAARGKVFKADEVNSALSAAMVQTAKKLSMVKERAAKATSAKKQGEEDNERADVTNKLDKLEEEGVAKSPIV